MADVDPFDFELWAAEWSKPNWGNFHANLAFLEKTGLLCEPRKVLEIGTGQGMLLGHLREHGHAVIGCDRDVHLVSRWRRDLPLLIASGDQLPFAAEAFDLVASFDVFEHIADSDAHLREVRRVLRPRGHYLLQTPNKLTNAVIEPLLWAQKFGVKHALACFKPPAHCALHTYWQLRSRFENNGFTLQYFEIPVVNDYFKEKLTRALGKLGPMLLKVCNPDRLPLPLRTNFYVMATAT
jgi:SAM-dependent methyltransferase